MANNTMVSDSQAGATHLPLADSVTSKLRETCQACASSKVKCNKKKPTCSRCEKRGTACEYDFTKRPGRKRDNQRSATSKTNNCIVAGLERPRSGQEPWASADDSLTGAATTPCRDAPHLTTPTLSSASTHSWIVSTADPADTFTDLLLPLATTQSSEFIMGSMTDFLSQPLDLLDPELLAAGTLTSASPDIPMFLIPDDTELMRNLDVHPIDSPVANPTPPLSSSEETSLIDEERGCRAGSDGCCLPRALDLMQKLSTKTKTTDCRDFGASKTSSSFHTSTPSTETVVQENKRVIEEVSNMLQCFCEGDVYLVTLMAMLVFKVLERFATAAKHQLCGDTNATDRLSSSALTSQRSTDVRRVAAQLVLGELHGVQQLVNALAPRLKAEGAKASIKNPLHSSHIKIASGKDRSVEYPELKSGETKEIPFSATTLDNLEYDMRKCLNRLSTDIIDGLRKI